MSHNHRRDLNRFYAILGELNQAIGRRCLADCHGQMGWPTRGVYFFFEDGEYRRDGRTPRVVRVGTHAVAKGAHTELWKRLRMHRGTKSGGGNHRASLFRRHVGGALLDRDHSLQPKPASWGVHTSAPKSVRLAEVHVEQAVSEYIREMPFLWIVADDEPGVSSIRSVIERNAIALLSCHRLASNNADPPSPDWLGHHCRSEKVRRSGLWNVNHIDDAYDPEFLELLADFAKQTTRLEC